MLRRRVALTLALAVVALPHAAAALEPFLGIRPLGTGGAMRGAATADAGPLMNPSGMSLVRSYALEGAYLYDSPDSLHAAHVSIVDNTSGFGLAGGVYYTYVTAEPEVAGVKAKRSGHEGGLALSFPLGEKVFLGATGKAFKLNDPTSKKTLTVDAGVTIRPLAMVSVGAAGQNLVDAGTPEAPRMLGYGVAVTPVPELVLLLDGLTTSVPTTDGHTTKTSYMGGGEYVFVQKLAVRAGGGHDAVRGAGYFGLGLSALSQVGAIDLGFHRDVSGDVKTTSVGVSARWFVDTSAGGP